MKPPLGASMQKHSMEASGDLLLKQDRIARFAPEKQFSTFHHREPKLKRLGAAHLHQVFRQAIYVILIISAVASLVLLLVGVLLNRRSCLTAGCILGLACFGAMLHGCLRHRSLPSTPTPLVLSAAYVCPVGSIPIGANPETSAAATAMATATLLPKSIHPNSSLMASSLEAAMLAQLRRDVSIAFPAGVSWASTHSVARPSLFQSTNEEQQLSAHGYARQLSDSVAYTRSSGTSGANSGSSVPELQTHLSCPARTGDYAVKSHIYENWSPNPGVHSSERGEKQFHIALSLGAFSKFSPDRQSTSENPDSQTTNPPTPKPGTSAFYKPPMFPVSENRAVRTGSSTNRSVPEDSTCTGSASKKLPVSGVANGPSQVRVISPEKSQFIRTPRSVMQRANQDSGLDSAVSTGLLRLLSDSVGSNYGDMHQPRRHNREREGIFGPRIWRGWRSWVD
ncbi:hypothetical protein FGIG_11919 [Fasciola gigantica]|uniref:Uncharacterized protein n=1 Tax=Fasciola gigantica TaxID=46835 RepID=A0A504YXB1_FASGI|nr:hypothetical protein FGIG_11919 [Fasciola gigantica]